MCNTGLFLQLRRASPSLSLPLPRSLLLSPGRRLHIWRSAEPRRRGSESRLAHDRQDVVKRESERGKSRSLLRRSYWTRVFFVGACEAKENVTLWPRPLPPTSLSQIYYTVPLFLKTALLLSAGTFPRSTTRSGAAKTSPSAGELLWCSRPP